MSVGDNNPPRDFLSAQAESRSFARLRRRVLRTLLRQTFAHARFRLTLIVVLTGLLWGGMFWMFADGFTFLQSTISNAETHARTVGSLFGQFFFWLMPMLAFSAGIILYGGLFRSREAAFLLTTPARTERIFLHKFHEAAVLSSWGFLLLGSPILMAYGVVNGAPWYYYALLLPLAVAFVYMMVALGAIVCLWLVRCVPNHLGAVLLGAAALLLGGVVWFAWELYAGPRNDLLTPDWFREIIQRLQFSDQRLLPNWWLSSGLMAAAGRDWAESTLFLALLVSNALFFRQLALWSSAWTYRAAYSALQGRSRRRRRLAKARLDKALTFMIGWVSTPVRLMAVKDLRLFRRDPLQWSQFMIFFGLLALYFFNVRSFTYDVSSMAWVNMVSFLNLSVVGLLLSTFTTRFIYPMISVEGRRFWILGLLGMPRGTLLWAKFFFAAAGSIVPCAALVALSDLMLGVAASVLVSHQMTCLVLCLGLAGIAVGFGAWLPNFREESPSRIAAGFGGTLTLVVSTLYILIIVLLTALPTHFYLAAQYAGLDGKLQGGANIQQWLVFWWWAGAVASLLLGAAVTLVPLWLGFRAFRRFEF
jgi:ABC-2 type transport system permease protein